MLVKGGRLEGETGEAVAAAALSRVLGFGIFGMDMLNRELRRRGIRVKLQDQPFQILSALLEHPGQIVTREDLRKTLWPGDTFVDFNNSVNAAVNRLRETLGDSAENPRFVETVPRSEEHTSELQSHLNLVCRLLLEKKKKLQH